MLKKTTNSLLPKNGVDREALTHTISKIKPRLALLQKGLQRLKYIFLKPSILGLVLILTLGHSPILFSPIISTAYAKEEQTPQFVLPHIGYISTYYSPYHPGVDIATDFGTSVHPLAPGTVEDIIYDKYGYGTHVIISHQAGFGSLYGHMGKVAVKVGEQVNLETVLGSVGLTGRTSGPHTHIEITHNGAYLDPSTVLPKVLPLQPDSFIYSVGGSSPKEDEPKLRKTLKPNFN